MNCSELADRVASEHGLDKGEAKRVVETTLAVITAAASAGEEVNLSGFGKFKVADRPARQGHNPATGEPMEIAASKKLTFLAAKTVRDALNKA